MVGECNVIGLGVFLNGMNETATALQTGKIKLTTTICLVVMLSKRLGGVDNKV